MPSQKIYPQSHYVEHYAADVLSRCLVRDARILTAHPKA